MQDILKILRQYKEGLSYRNNSPAIYLPHMVEYFDCIKNDTLYKIPPPLCVQIQISSNCNTHCVICDNWKDDKNKSYLTTEKLNDLFKQIKDFGIKAIILSGGEPLIRDDLIEILKNANELGLKIGMLTNGMLTNGTTSDYTTEQKTKIMKAISKYVSWVAISIDGTPVEDTIIRPTTPEGQKWKDLKTKLTEFYEGIRNNVGINNPPNISATVTLQKTNIPVKLSSLFGIIVEKIKIPHVNFKFVTGSIDTLAEKPDYLMSESDVKDLEYFLFNNYLPTDSRNNLSYIQRCFAKGYFTIKDVAEGAPVRSFYKQNSIRCFMPFLFTLIDTDGSVYPCCHLYRDNHGTNNRSKRIRAKHKMGKIQEKRLSLIWKDGAYVEERRELEIVDPAICEFTPCGECTRYFQHNVVLTKIYEIYKDNSKALTEYISLNFRTLIFAILL